jgi:acyl-CoA reductase-like NAD-dependent aldehyde dehydrogenase
MPKPTFSVKFSSPLPLYSANNPVQSSKTLPVLCKFTNEEITSVSVASRAEVQNAITRAVHAAGSMASLRPYERRDILTFCLEEIRSRQKEFAETICLEAGKPIKQARGEVKRTLDTFALAAEEAVRPPEQLLNLEREERYRGRRALVRLVPRGVCSFITPFNFPLNLVAHKVAPALAAGCPFVLKPSSQTPLSALMLGEILSRTSLPTGAFSVLPCEIVDAAPFVEDTRVSFLSFTGSGKVGWDMKRRAGRKRVALELGGNAACIVDERISLDEVVSKLVTGAFAFAGQSCISVQRIIVHTDVYAELREALLDGIQALKVGDPRREETEVGPLISTSEAERIEKWIQDAVKAGGRLLCGGDREGSLISPTLLEDVPPGQAILDEEVFGPVAVLQRVESLEAAFAEANRSRYGLQVGLFTEALDKAFEAWHTVQVGAIIVGDVPSWRADAMPYGGVKESGFGREGVASAIRSMSEERLLVLQT